MNGKRLLKRLVTVFLGMLGFFLFLHAVDSDAQEAVSYRLTARSASVRLPAVGSPPSAPTNPLR